MHVDDFIVFSNSARLYKEVYEAYFSRVDGEDGPLDYYNGVNFEVDYTQQTIKLSSERTIDSIVQRYGTPLRQTTVPAAGRKSWPTGWHPSCWARSPVPA